MPDPPARTSRIGTILVLAFVFSLTGIGIGRTLIHERPSSAVGTGEQAHETYIPFEQLDELRIEGMWRVRVSDDPTWRGIRVETPMDGRGGNPIRRRGNSLTLDRRAGHHRSQVEISVVELNRLTIDGTSQVELDRLTLDRFEIAIDGAGRVEAYSVTIEDLEIETDGAASIDFADAAVTDAEVDIDGVGRVTLDMRGGSLSGRIDGAGRIEYRGSVSRESVEIDGIGSVGVRR